MTFMHFVRFRNGWGWVMRYLRIAGAWWQGLGITRVGSREDSVAYFRGSCPWRTERELLNDAKRSRPRSSARENFFDCSRTCWYGEQTLEWGCSS